MLTIYSRTWGSLLVQGAVLIAFGLSLTHIANGPALTVGLAALLLATAVRAVSVGLRLNRVSSFGWFVFAEGAFASIVAMSLFRPDRVAESSLLACAAAFAVVSGLLQISLIWPTDARARVSGILCAGGALPIGVAMLLVSLSDFPSIDWPRVTALVSVGVGIGCWAIGVRLRSIQRSAAHQWSRDIALALCAGSGSRQPAVRPNGVRNILQQRLTAYH
jgi:hypothetical protein